MRNREIQDIIEKEVPQIKTQLEHKANESEVRKKSVPIMEQDLTDSLKASISGTAPINPVLLDKSIRPEKTTFFETGNNIISEIVVGEYINADTGVVMTGTDWARTCEIGVVEGEYINIYRARQVVYLTSDKKYISGNSYAGNISHRLLIPSNCAYIIFSWYKSDVPNVVYNMSNRGDLLLAYEPYKTFIPQSRLEQFVFDVEKDVKKQSISTMKLKDIVPSLNLFDINKIIKDKYVNSDNGNLTIGVGFSAYEVDVESNTDYWVSSVRHFAFLNANGAYISGKPNSSAMNEYVIKTPSNCKKIRFSWFNSDCEYAKYMFIKGKVKIPYTSYEDVKISKRVIEQTGTDILINLPQNIYATVGQKLDIIFQNIVNVDLRSYQYQINVDAHRGLQLEDRYTVTPTIEEDFNFKIEVYKDYELVKTKECRVKVASATKGSGNSSVLVIGDSTTNSGGTTQRLLDLFSIDTTRDITLLGTRGSGLNKHEGRGGWSWSMYRQKLEYNTGTGDWNPFYSDTTKDFNFSNYMINQKYTGVDYVILNLGINDTYNYLTDNSLITDIPSILNNANFIVNSIKTYNSNIKIGIHITIPPNTSQNAYAQSNNTGITQWRYKRNNSIWCDKLIENFVGRESENIYLLPVNANLDCINNIRDNVHPNIDGEKQIGDVVYNFIKYN